MSVRESFVATFGEEQAAAVEKAGTEHYLRDIAREERNFGSDPFKLALVFVIGFECVSKFAKDHGITVPAASFQKWCIEHGELASHDGDFDGISMMIGVYKDFLAPGVTGDK